MRSAAIAVGSVAALFCAANSASAQVNPIAVTGWNHDMVLNGPGPFDTSVTGTMDGGFAQIENWTWVEKGTYTNPNGDSQDYEGLVAGTHASLTGSGNFEFQPFSANNVVGLNGGQSGTLTLDSPAAYSAIALYGASGFGAKTATITLNFDDSSTAIFNVDSGTGIGSDWFNSGADKAFEAKGRASNKSEELYTRLFYQQNDAIGINESYFTLSATDSAKLLESVTIQNTGGDRMVVFAISGQTIPEPTTAALFGLAGVAAFLSPRRGA
jgi:hypothetical protein